jgi:hypothetical protein
VAALDDILLPDAGRLELSFTVLPISFGLCVLGFKPGKGVAMGQVDFDPENTGWARAAPIVAAGIGSTPYFFSQGALCPLPFVYGLS